MFTCMAIYTQSQSVAMFSSSDARRWVGLDLHEDFIGGSVPDACLWPTLAQSGIFISSYCL